MLDIQFDQKKKEQLKELLIHSRDETSIQVKCKQPFTGIEAIDLLFLQLDLLSNEEVNAEDVKRFLDTGLITREEIEFDLNHPLELLKEENRAFQFIIKEIDGMVALFTEQPNERTNTERIDELEIKLLQLGSFRKHYHRKEKLIFPILESYGYHTPIRKNWLIDDQIRAFYKALQKQLMRIPYEDYERFEKRYAIFSNKFRLMIAIEELLLFPILQLCLNENDWHRVANESDAFGYSIIKAPIEKWSSEQSTSEEEDRSPHLIQGGGGFLTTKEAELIFNQLPLEITFVDKNDVFKYFNDVVEAPDMILVRTPISIGRNVANCHPPKNLKKVMQLVRDLKTGKRESESMWFKMKGKYVHITYKGLFDEDGEYLGILEYVQDIQPFFELPTEQKRGLTRIEE